jgi:hypothetical protein
LVFYIELTLIYSAGQPTTPFDPKTEGDAGDPNNNRVVADYQGDEVKKHGHTAQSSGPFAHYGGPGMGLQSDNGQEFTFPNPSITVNDYDGAESRPRNISVYFYIKIN